MATVSIDGAARVWDVETARRNFAMRAPPGYIPRWTVW